MEKVKEEMIKVAKVLNKYKDNLNFDYEYNEEKKELIIEYFAKYSYETFEMKLLKYDYVSNYKGDVYKTITINAFNSISNEDFIFTIILLDTEIEKRILIVEKNININLYSLKYKGIVTDEEILEFEGIIYESIDYMEKRDKDRIKNLFEKDHFEYAISMIKDQLENMKKVI